MSSDSGKESREEMNQGGFICRGENTSLLLSRDLDLHGLHLRDNYLPRSLGEPT